MIFPTLVNKRFGYVNLNKEAISYADQNNQEGGFLNPEICQQMVESVHKKYNLDFSFGGWMEDRSFLWKGSYLEEKKNFIHLGVDLNVPVGTDVAANFNGKVVKVDSDYPEEGGWGTRVIIKHETLPVFMIYAHLAPEIQVQVGDQLILGTVFAQVGKAPYNGNWFPHLHVQTISVDYYQYLEVNNAWHELDGYGLERDVLENSNRFVDPMNYIVLKNCE